MYYPKDNEERHDHQIISFRLFGKETRNIFKKDNRRSLNGRVFDNLLSTMNTFTETLYFLHVEIMANLDHYNSIGFKTLFPSNNLGNQTMQWQ